jgi:hypothetical protein
MPKVDTGSGKGVGNLMLTVVPSTNCSIGQGVEYNDDGEVNYF